MRRLGALRVGVAVVVAACHAGPSHDAPMPDEPRLVDAQATAETRALFVNLRRLAGRQVMFGHQDDLAYGHDWVNEPGRSDVKDVAGSYPAVYGWELGNLEKGMRADLDGVSFEQMRGWIIGAFQRGGVVTISWHMSNPATGGSAWDTTAALATILPGGAQHARYVAWLDRFAEFAGSLRAPAPGGRLTLVPVIFRPFHEMGGGWFWWGASHASPQDYQRLWRFTVEYLRDTKGVHNVLWAYSPDARIDAPRERFWTWYPGDGYVDVIGVDDYSTLQAPDDPVGAMTAQLRWLASAAESRGKMAAITETGFETIPDSTWWTARLLAAIQRDSLARRIAYVLVWRNANRRLMGREHFYAPYSGHASAADFRRFRADPLIAFEDELPPLYRLPSDR